MSMHGEISKHSHTGNQTPASFVVLCPLPQAHDYPPFLTQASNLGPSLDIWMKGSA